MRTRTSRKGRTPGRASPARAQDEAQGGYSIVPDVEFLVASAERVADKVKASGDQAIYRRAVRQARALRELLEKLTGR